MKIDAYQCDYCRRRHLDATPLIFAENPGYEHRDPIVHFCSTDCMEKYRNFLSSRGWLISQNQDEES